MQHLRELTTEEQQALQSSPAAIKSLVDELQGRAFAFEKSYHALKAKLEDAKRMLAYVFQEAGDE